MAGGRRAPLSAHLHGHRGTRARRVPNSRRPARARGDGDPCRRSSRARATSISSESRAGGGRDARRCEPASIKLKLGTLLLQRAAARRDRGRWEDPAPVLGRPISVAGETRGDVCCTYAVRLLPEGERTRAGGCGRGGESLQVGGGPVPRARLGAQMEMRTRICRCAPPDARARMAGRSSPAAQAPVSARLESPTPPRMVLRSPLGRRTLKRSRAKRVWGARLRFAGRLRRASGRGRIAPEFQMRRRDLGGCLFRVGRNGCGSRSLVTRGQRVVQCAGAARETATRSRVLNFGGAPRDRAPWRAESSGGPTWSVACCGIAQPALGRGHGVTHVG